MNNRKRHSFLLTEEGYKMGSTLQEIKRHILYGSVTKSIYHEVTPLLVRENNATLRGLSIITVVFGGVLSLLSISGVLSRNVLPAYLFLFLSSVFFILYRRFVPVKNAYISYVLCTLQCMALLTFGMFNSAVFAPSRSSNGTIFVVMLLVIPFLMIDVPYRMDLILVAFTFVYCILIRYYKEPAVVSLDTTNTVAICLVSCMCNWIFAGKSMRSLADRLYIERERDTDALTGLLTKQSAQILTDTHLNHGGHGVFAIIDVDDFKNVNDNYGHLYGDKVLKKIANCIKENTRRTDVAARFGGDEFTIFLVDMEMDMAREKTEAFFDSLRRSFADEEVQITCSVGITYARPQEEYDVLFESADKVLYESKKAGKNRYTTT